MAIGGSFSASISQKIAEPVVSENEILNHRVTQLYEAHRDGIYRFLVAQGLPVAEAQEIAQDVFVRFLVAVQDGGQIISERGWLYTVAAKCAVDHWRRESRSCWIQLDLNPPIAETLNSPEPSPEAQASNAEQVRRVADAILKLPREQRMCIQLRSQSLRYREIAEILGVGVSTVADWVAIAVKRVRGVVND